MQLGFASVDLTRLPSFHQSTTKRKISLCVIGQRHYPSVQQPWTCSQSHPRYSFTPLLPSSLTALAPNPSPTFPLLLLRNSPQLSLSLSKPQNPLSPPSHKHLTARSWFPQLLRRRLQPWEAPRATPWGFCSGKGLFFWAVALTTLWLTLLLASCFCWMPRTPKRISSSSLTLLAALSGSSCFLRIWVSFIFLGCCLKAWKFSFFYGAFEWYRIPFLFIRMLFDYISF